MRDDTEYSRQGGHGHGLHARHFREHHGHGPDERRHHRGGEDGSHFGRGHFGGLHFGGPRDRAKRGDARYILLNALRDGPKHGYEIIKTMEEKSGGQYVPSPGTVYPTMQYLEDQGLVGADQDAGKRIFHLTDAGRADLEAHAEEIAAFWQRFGGEKSSETPQPEIGFLREELEHLTRTVWGGLRDTAENAPETIRSIHQAVEQCRSAVREIITASRQN